MSSIKGTLNAIESVSDGTGNGFAFEFEIMNVLHLRTPLCQWTTESTGTARCTTYQKENFRKRRATRMSKTRRIPRGVLMCPFTSNGRSTTFLIILLSSEMTCTNVQPV